MSTPQQINKKQLPQSCYGACTHPPGLPPLKLQDALPAATADLMIGTFFFANRSCEFFMTKKPGQTKIVTLQ
jgi:hypothetical protein